MKNILVPTDFSDCAGYALDFAFAMSMIYNANIYVFHNITEKKSILNPRKEEKEEFHEKQELEKMLKEKFEKLSKNSPINRKKIKSYYAKGDLVENINEYIKEHNIDFIVMGSHGVSGRKERIIGSNTQKVVRSAHRPVFVVKNSIKDYNINKVVFASNFVPEEVQALEYMLEFLKPFNPEIHLVEINTSSFYAQPYALEKKVLNDFKEMCKGYKCETHFYKDSSVEAGIRHITDEINADLIIVSNVQKHKIRNIFNGSNVEKVVNHAEVPVLSIDFDLK